MKITTSILIIAALTGTSANAVSVCKLVPTRKDFAPETYDGEALSSYWSSEYTGADLTRELLNSMGTQLPKNQRIVDVVDSPADFMGYHGISVASIVAGPHPSAAIPASDRLAVTPVTAIPEYLRSNADAPAAYVNASLNLTPEADGFKGIDMKGLFRSADESGTVVIGAAGNEGVELEGEVLNLARRNLILVGNAAEKGVLADNSNFSRQIIVSAPANDDQLLSFNRAGEAERFGGTSGAAPQVTAALTAFTLITNYRLTKTEAEVLLRATATKPLFSFQGTGGAGLLNTFKIALVAKELVRRCTASLSQSVCLKNGIRDPLTYEPAFTSTDNNLLTSNSKVNDACSARRYKFKTIRARALATNDPVLWKTISAVYEHEGYKTQAKFYRSLAELKNEQNVDRYALRLLSDEESIAFAFSYGRGSKALAVIRDYLAAKRDIIPVGLLLRNKEWMEFITSAARQSDRIALSVIELYKKQNGGVFEPR